jgi:hypothetical protein
VMDNRYARRASPALPLPDVPFAHPEDASEQIRRAVEAHLHHFARKPRGVWPSEGAICPEIVFRLAAEGFSWFASDEAVLALSVGEEVRRDGYGHVTNPRLLYQPYRTHVGDRPPLPSFAIVCCRTGSALSTSVGTAARPPKTWSTACTASGRTWPIRTSPTW